MRKLKITSNTHDLGDDFDKKLSQAALGKLAETEREKLWAAVNNSNETEAIQQLVNSYEFEILTTIRQIDHPHLSLDEMLEAGKSSLAKMILRSPGHQRKAQFEKFGMWWVRQGILSIKK